MDDIEDATFLLETDIKFFDGLLDLEGSDLETPSATQLMNKISTPAVSSKSEEKARFAKPKDIKIRNLKVVPKKTRQVNCWAVSVWRDWAKSRNLNQETRLEPGYSIAEDVGSDEMLDYWGQRFIMEIHRKDGRSCVSWI